MKRPEYYSSELKLPTYEAASRFLNSASTSLSQKPLARSNSFDQLREATLASLDEPTPRVRARHRTLAYGVDELDLDKARSSVDQLPVSSNWRKNDITRELMREDLQIELEALKDRCSSKA